MLTLGEYQGNDIGEMAGFLFDQHIRISDSITPILPKELDLSQVDETQIGQWVKFSNVQFTRASLGKHSQEKKWINLMENAGWFNVVISVLC